MKENILYYLDKCGEVIVVIQFRLNLLKVLVGLNVLFQVAKNLISWMLLSFEVSLSLTFSKRSLSWVSRIEVVDDGAVKI